MELKAQSEVDGRKEALAHLQIRERVLDTEIEELSSALNGNVVPDGSPPHDESLRYSLNSRTSEISQPMAPQPFNTSFASLAFRPKPGFARERKHWDGRGGSRDMSLRRWENERRNRKGKDVVAREANTRRYQGADECDELPTTASK
jgi:hypothetical protein